jgi:hypothetical protein
MPLLRKLSDFRDKTLIFKSFLPIRVLVGTGLLLGAFIPWHFSLLLAFPCLAPSVVKVLMTRLGRYQDPMDRLVQRGRKTALIKGDFAVFHIGARPNNTIDNKFKHIGDAMAAIQQELEDRPELGCLGTENYIGENGQGTFTVQYWRSLEHLNAYARSSTNRHYSPWKRLMQIGRESSDIAFWHEAFEVKDGKYECIYVNCPPLLLGNCRETELIQCEGRLNSAAGRAGKSDGADYPTQLGIPDY